MDELWVEASPSTFKTFLQTGSGSQSNSDTVQCDVGGGCQFCLRDNTYVKNGFCGITCKLQFSNIEIKKQTLMSAL